MFNLFKNNLNVTIERNVVFHDVRYEFSLEFGHYCTDIKIYHLYPTEEYEVNKDKYRMNEDGSLDKYVYRKSYTVTEESYRTILAKYLKDI